MISYMRLPGSANLDGLGMPDLKAYWETVKANIANFKNLGFQISTHQQKLGVVKGILVARNDKNQNIMDDEITKTQDDLDKYWRVQGYIDKYLPEWAKLDDPNGTVTPPPSAVGFIPLILGVAAIAALAYCVTVGMSLVQEYAFKSQLTTDVIEGKITSGQAAEVLSVPGKENVFEEAIQKVSLGVGFGIPTALLVGGGLYLMFTTGMLKSIFGGLFGGGSSQSST